MSRDFQPDWTVPASGDLSGYVSSNPMPQIKPLVWERVHTFAVQAKTAFGEITITEIGPFRCEVAFFDDEIVCQSINSARKKAEAEYERRIRECLE